jgi:DNA polymerase-3 subunit alpha
MMYSLQNYTAYSRGFGTANIKDWAKAAKKLGYPALGVCDRTTLAGAPRLVKACREAGIKPLLGMDVYLHESDERDENNKPIARLLLFALNDDGYQRLVKLNNRSQDREGLFYFRPRVTMEALLGACKDVACVLPYNGGGKLSTAVFEGSKGKFSGIVSQLHSMFETRFFIGCNPLENPEEIEALLDRGTMPYDVVYSFNCTGPTTEAAEASRTLMSLMKEDKPICNNGGVYSLPTQALAESRLGEPALQKFDFGMKRLFDMVTDFFVVGDYKLPEPPVPDLLAYMEQRLADGWRQKLDPTVKPGTTLRQIAQDPDLDKKFSYLLEKAGDKYANKHTLKEYMDQLLNEEIPLIVSKKFLPYFYIIDDICAHIDRVGLDRGVGRGSGAGSIFNYLTNITQCDPLRHGLSFSRFLSSARTDLPDIDLDFSDIARREVHRYLASVYGRQRLLNIGTYNRMKVKSAVKALAAAAAYTITDNDGEEVPYDPYFLNQILDVHTTQTSRGQDELDEMLTNDRFMEFYAKHSRFFMTKVMPLLESITSNGMHAAGIVICLGDAMSELPVLYNSTLEGYVTQYEMDAVDDAGRPKLDLLVIEAVDVVTAAKQMLKDYEGITIPGVEEINLQDKQALLTFRNVQTHPIFQFGTWSQRRFLRPLVVDSFEELVAAVALVRPGPMQAGTDKLFIDIKHGREKRPDDHPSISEVLSESHGLMIYQEQMMRLSQVMAGFTGEEAEKLRKACGKKKPEEMAKWEAHYKTGSRKRGYTEDVTNKMWSQIVEFASYSFNKSHSVAYTLTSFYQAWIKSRYPLYFWAAKMRFAKDDLKHPNNVYELKRYAEEEGIEFLFPTVHGFSQDFKPAGAGNQVFWKISAIKGVGDKAAALITNNGTINSFPDMDSFMSTLIRKKEVIDGVTVQESTGQVMNSRVMTALIGAGFFAPEYTPIEAMKRYREYMRVLNKKKVADELPPEFLKTFVDGKGNFDHTASQFYWAKLRNETLNCQVGRWKEIAGFDHDNIQTFTEAQFNKIDDGKLVFIGGEVKQVSYYKYKSGRNAGKNWAQLIIEDGSERYVVKCWNEFWDNPALDRTRRRPSQGDLIELRGIKESFNGRSYIALNKPTDYCRIVAR